MAGKTQGPRGDKSAPGQGTFDFTRGDQLWMIDNVNLDSFRLSKHGVAGAGQSVAATHQLLILARIDSRARQHGVCFESQESMADHFKVSLRTIKAAIAALKEQGLIAIAREATRQRKRGGTLNRYVIVWSEMSLRSGYAGRLKTSDQSATDVDQSATDVDQSATDDSCSLYGSVKRSVKESPPPTPSPADPPRREPSAWMEVEEEVFHLGVDMANQAVAHARRRGAIVSDLRALCAEYQARQGQFATSGPLYVAINKWRPGLAATSDRLWPRTMKEIDF